MLEIAGDFRLLRPFGLRIGLPKQFNNRPKKYEVEAELRMAAEFEEMAASKKFRFDRVSFLVDYEIKKAKRERAHMYCLRY